MNSRQNNINHNYLYLLEVANGLEVEIGILGESLSEIPIK